MSRVVRKYFTFLFSGLHGRTAAYVGSAHHLYSVRTQHNAKRPRCLYLSAYQRACLGAAAVLICRLHPITRTCNSEVPCPGLMYMLCCRSRRSSRRSWVPRLATPRLRLHSPQQPARRSEPVSTLASSKHATIPIAQFPLDCYLLCQSCSQTASLCHAPGGLQTDGMIKHLHSLGHISHCVLQGSL